MEPRVTLTRELWHHPSGTVRTPSTVRTIGGSPEKFRAGTVSCYEHALLHTDRRQPGGPVAAGRRPGRVARALVRRGVPPARDRRRLEAGCKGCARTYS